MRNNHTFSRRAVIAGFATVPAFSVTRASVDGDAAPPMALARKLNETGQPVDQTVTECPVLDKSSEWPNASTTGVQSGVTLTSHSGDLVVRSNGQLVEALDVSGQIIIPSNFSNVTVRNCRTKSGIAFNPDSVPGTGTNLKIEHCECPGGIVLVFCHNSTVRRCNISNVENGIWLEANGCSIEENYLHDILWEAPRHGDGLQIETTLFSVSNNSIRHNNFDLPLNVSSCIQMRDATNITVESNRFSGGTYCVYLLGTTKGCQITNNSFVKWVYGPLDNEAGATNTIRGNIFARRNATGCDIPK